MMKLLIFGGTTEGRELAEYLAKRNKKYHKYDVKLSVATDYGAKFIDDNNIDLLVGRMNRQDIVNLLEKEKFDYIIDATHPYAVEVTQNIKNAVSQSKIGRYVRLLRNSSDLSGCTIVNSIEEACRACDQGNILASTGSKQIAEYASLYDFQNRVYARVLPTDESVNLCIRAGFDMNHIITNTGAVSIEDNIHVIERYEIKNIITKDGGKKGGFDQKRIAADMTGAKLIVIDRPREEGMVYDELVDFLSELEKNI